MFSSSRPSFAGVSWRIDLVSEQRSLYGFMLPCMSAESELCPCCIFHSAIAVYASIYTETLFNTLRRCGCFSVWQTHTHTHRPHHLLSACLVNTSVLYASARHGRSGWWWKLSDANADSITVVNLLKESVCLCACERVRAAFTQRAPGSRALQWLVKTPSRALGFELAFCQASCQEEAATLADCECVCCVVFCATPVQLCDFKASVFPEMIQGFHRSQIISKCLRFCWLPVWSCRQETNGIVEMNSYQHFHLSCSLWSSLWCFSEALNSKACHCSCRF